ncbi:MAG: hypothetical protein U1F43_31855 [Myxococcota bacterium]
MGDRYGVFRSSTSASARPGHGAGRGPCSALIAFYFVYPPLAFALHRVWAEKPRNVGAARPTPTTSSASEEGHDLDGLRPRRRCRAYEEEGGLGHAGERAMVGAALGSVCGWPALLRPDMGKFRAADAQTEQRSRRNTRPSRAHQPGWSSPRTSTRPSGSIAT